MTEPRKFTEVTALDVAHWRVAAATDAAVRAYRPDLKPTPGHVPAARKLELYEAWLAKQSGASRDHAHTPGVKLEGAA